MEKNINFQMEEIAPDWLNDYPEDKFTVFKTCFLSTQKNSHNLDISAEVLKRDAKTILGNFLVAKLQYGDASTHLPSEIIYGYFPKEQEVEFEDTEDGIVKAWAYCVISKQYGQEFNEIFDLQNLRNTSVEMKVKVVDDADEGEVESFDIYGLTCLGLSVKGSCPDAMMTMIRFSQEDADAYFNKMNEHNLTPLKKFVKERTKNMAEKKYVSHPINTSKDAVYTGEWDGNKAKQDLIKEKNYKSLAPKVCLNLEEGWEGREVTKLGYPVMGLFDGEWRYSTRALASALAYAKQNDEQEVLNKLKEIYDELDLNEEGKEDDEKMSKEVAFAAVDLNLMWTKINNELRARNYDWHWYIDGIFEQDNKKFVIIRNDGGDRFRINFSYTEDGLFMDDEMVKVDIEFIETDDIKRFSCPEEFKHLMGEEGEPEEPKDEPDEKDAIIMQKDAEIDELRKELDELKAYKAAIEEKEIAKRVEDILDEVKDYLDDDKYQELRTEGLACGKDEIDAFSNKVKAQCFNAFKKAAKKNADKIFAFSKPIEIQKKDMSTMNVWDRIKENY